MAKQGPRCVARQSPQDPNRWFLDFDVAAPGGKGGASVLLDPAIGMASVDSVVRNALLPRHSTGGLVAEGVALAGMSRPAILEAYNVEKSTRAALAAGSDGQGTLLGNLLADSARALGGTVIRWETVPAGNALHLRVHLCYP